MKITEIRTYVLEAALDQNFGFSQWEYSRRSTLLVEVATDGGLSGWGEAYGPAKPAASAVNDFFAPHLTGRDPRDTETLWHFLFARGIDYGQKGLLLAAISALDIAFWDLKAQAAGLSLYRLLGASETESVPCYATGFYFGGPGCLEGKFEREAALYLERGFRAAKMKVGLGIERDAELVGAVRGFLGPSMRLMIDANHAYTPQEAIALARKVEKYGIHWFEEPVSPLDVEGYLAVKQATSIPLAGGECEYTRFGFEPLLRRRAVDFAQPDLCACGGISEGLKIATLASVYNVHVTPHAWGSAIGQAAALHFYAARPRHPGSLTAEDKMIECDQTENPFRTAIVREPIRFERGAWFLPQRPGLGIEIQREALTRYCAG
ncbi:MAG TPA: mandelate racemase/muconate lactonizing enzyme family protein [Bryobacteraceae bacterium]|jgi:D-galactarolactone cycloisomerase|nr:mandelate racemase/muconate lactonizing enzyme family protein [Bryobacteraceae bacterium]